MNSLHLFVLPFPAIYQIYNFLDSSSKINLWNTSKQARLSCSHLKRYDHYCSKIAAFIFHNYQVAATSFKLTDLKKIFFQPQRLIVLGEIHSQDTHRLLNANLIDLIWNNNSVLQIEGGISSLENSRKNQDGPLKYLREEIAELAGSWDVSDNNSISELYLAHYQLSITIIRIIQKLLILCDDENKDFSLFIDECFEESLALKIYDDIPEINHLKENQEILGCCEKFKLTKLIYKKLVVFMLAFFTDELEKYKKPLQEASTIRNAYLINNIIELLLTSQKSGIFLAGNNHANNSTLLSEIKRFSRQTAIPFLVLIPKETVTENSINSSHKKLFPNSSCQVKKIIREKDEKVEKLFSLISQDESLQVVQNANDFQHLKNCLINCEIEKIDRNANHYGEWLSLSFALLMLERDRLEKNFTV